MQELTENEFLEFLENESIDPFQIYNLDIDYPQYFSVKHYLENESDNIDANQSLNILFLDIEVYTKNEGIFPEPSAAKFPISCITTYSTFEKVYRGYILLQQNKSQFPTNVLEIQTQFIEELKANKYIKSEEERIEILTFSDELTLIKKAFEDIHRIDPAVLSGWNSDGFDMPYIYFRLSNLLGKDETAVGQIMSKFGKIKMNRFGDRRLLQIPDYPISDLQYLFKPRDEGGLNYGKKQSDYTLNWTADLQLKLKKLDYGDSGLSLDAFYEKNPLGYLKYNIIDVILCKLLNEKFRHIELHNMLRRLMKTSFSKSLNGSTALFDTFVLYQLSTENKKVRFGLVNEITQSISQKEVENITRPKSSKIKWTVNKVDLNTVRKITSRYTGAYVKMPQPKIITEEDGIIIDLDATSLYPSMINQSNISFDTYFGRIIDPICYNSIIAINQILQTGGIPQSLHGSLMDLVTAYVKKLDPQNKKDYIQNLYFIISHLFNKLQQNRRPLGQIFQPQSKIDYIILKKYLLPLLDLLAEIHPKSTEYNTFAYEYLINGKDQEGVSELYIIEDAVEPTLRVNKVLVSDLAEYLSKNNLIISLAGVLFLKHETKSGLFFEFLTRMKAMRDKFKSLRDEYQEGTEEYRFYDMRQASVKIVMNTTYGLYGQSTFRYSNKWLAQAITTQSRLTLKIAQIVGEIYLQNQEN